MGKERELSLADGRRRFDAWRRRHAPGSRLPPELWAHAVDLARGHGVSKTSRELRLDYYSLERRLKDGASSLKRGAVMEFVDLSRDVLSGGRVSIVRVEDGSGLRLSVELRGVEAAEVESLARALWSERR